MRKFTYTLKYQIILLLIIVIIFNVFNYIKRNISIDSETIINSLSLFAQIVGLVFTVIIAFSFFSSQSNDNNRLSYFFAINDELNKLKNLLIQMENSQDDGLRFKIAVVVDSLENLTINNFPYTEEVNAKIQKFLEFLDSKEIRYQGMSTEDNFVDYVISILTKIEKFNNELLTMKVKIWFDGLIVSEIIKLTIVLLSNLFLIVLYTILSLDFELFNFFINPTLLICSFLFVLYSLLEIMQFIRDHYNNLIKDLNYE